MYIVVFTTASSKEEANKLSSGILEAKLAACVNVVGGLASHFWWQAKIDSANELLLIIKTRKAVLTKLIKKIKALHSYAIPEIIALPIIGGNKEYLSWIDDSTR